MNRVKSIATLVAVCLLFAGCSFTQGPGEKIQHGLDKSASIEGDFKELQQSLVRAENREQKLYNNILDLDLSKNEKEIASLSEQATKSANKREQLMRKEKEIIDHAYETFIQIKDDIKELNDPRAKEDAVFLVKTMDKRYGAFSKLYKNYMAAIECDRKLYDLLKEKNVTFETLQNQLEKTDNYYKEIKANQDDFNKATKTFNQAKLSFYKHADIKK
ncbi:putative cell-wall binding lipoprotein [Scopulibacillus darangshiensis]|uniref:Putative cell-wall binding lipoprotein n=1 Tax=Scopulibacillus darangshiensis TaxID=442528 RepID=A0A4R2P6Y6_9BACL|nr:YkyA family protein [Scopulibacillus darangshiensis]TCP30527.1 putative cell-wall binding lipoprotein [Scopulibacillus darangshiensis]